MVVQLLDDDGNLTTELEDALSVIFHKYATVKKDKDATEQEKKKEDKPSTTDVNANASITRTNLNSFALDTNGTTFSNAELDEITNNLAVDADGSLTLEGFYQMYWLQTSNDEQETWNDLEKHGFDQSLKRVSDSAHTPVKIDTDNPAETPRDDRTDTDKHT